MMASFVSVLDQLPDNKLESFSNQTAFASLLASSFKKIDRQSVQSFNTSRNQLRDYLSKADSYLPRWGPYLG
jgi:hypothetical protein